MFEGFTLATFSFFSSTTFDESSGSSTTVYLPPDSFTIRPVMVLSSVVRITDALYWSEMTLLGSTMASARSLTRR